MLKLVECFGKEVEGVNGLVSVFIEITKVPPGFTAAVGSTTIKPDQINMVVLFWYLVKSDDSVCYCTIAF